jgi:hypothetical protein
VLNYLGSINLIRAPLSNLRLLRMTPTLLTIANERMGLPSLSCKYKNHIAKHTKVDMIWVAGRSPTLVSYSLRGVAMNLKATTLTYLAIEVPIRKS